LHNWNPMCRRLYLLLKIFVHFEKPMNLLKYNNITFFIALFLFCGCVNDGLGCVLWFYCVFIVL
jgi:hypothetical protein